MDKRLGSTYWILKLALGAAPLIAGLDKFFNVLTNWADYLNPRALELVPVEADVFMRGVGVVEMLVGLLILTRWTKLGANLAACWLVAIAINLAAMEKFYDIAVREVLLAVAMSSLARIAAVRDSARVASDAKAWKPSPEGILTLKL